jgi:hypothetical protein
VRDVVRRALLVALSALATVPQQEAPAAATEPTRSSGTFFWGNAWAAHHTAPHGPSSGAARMRRLVRLVVDSRAELGALAEIERRQIAAFRRAAHGYRLFVGGRGTTDGVLWRTSDYDLVEAYRFRGFSYGGRRVRVPVTVLSDRATGGLLAVMAVHNPRDRWNARAYRRQMAEVRRLRRAYDHRISVFVAGDFNAGAWAACRAHRSRLFSAGHRRCDGWAPIDQLLTDRHVRIRRYRSLTGRRVDRITDHRVLYRTWFSLDRR